MSKNTATFYARKTSYRFYLFGKEMFRAPNFIGEFLYDHNLAIKVYKDIEIISISPDIQEIIDD